MLHYKPADGYFGDPIPYYWDGEYHMFYLLAPEHPLRRGADHTVYAHISSRDLLRWREHPIAIRPTPGGPDAVSCWTGSVIEKDGVFYLFYTGHGREVYEWPQTICLATSPDLDHWTKWPDNPLMKPDPAKFRISDWRDPFVFWSEQDQCYLMSITSMRVSDNFWKGGCLVMARSHDLIHWDVGEPYYHPGNHGYPECSDLFQMGGQWYCVMSIMHKTCYRIADGLQGPWRRARTDAFDGVLNYAAKTMCDGQRRFVVGWIRDKHGYQDDHNWEWAGVMAFPREIVREPDGTLYAKLPEEFNQIRGACLHDLMVPATRETAHGTVQPAADGLLLGGRDLFAQFQSRPTCAAFDLEAEFTLEETGTAGIVFNADAQRHPGYEIALDLRHQQLVFRRHTDRFHMYACTDIVIKPGETIRLRVIVEETLVEAFVNDKYALAGRFYHPAHEPRVGFFAEESNVLLRTCRLHDLNEIEADHVLDEVLLGRNGF